MGSALAKLLVEIGFLDHITGPLKATSAKVAGFGSAVRRAGLAMSAAFTIPLLAAGVALFKLGDAYDKMSDTIRIGTGATGDALTDLEQSAINVFKSIPTSMDAAGLAIADLNTKTGQTGKGLEDLARIEIELARITGGDLASQITSTTRLFGDWGVAVEDQVPTLDKLFRASQATGIGIDQLANLMVQFGAPLRQMGFGFDETAALLGKFQKEGVNTELVMGSLRIALGKMANEGVKDPAAALRILVDQIKNAGSAGEANAIALETFGARAGPDMAAAIREGRFDIDELFGIVKDGTETVLGAASATNSWRENLQILRNKISAALLPVANKLFVAVNKGVVSVTRLADRVGAFVRRLGPVPTKLKVLLGVFVGLLAAMGPVTILVGVLISAFAALLSPIGLVIAAVALLGTGFRSNFLGMRDAVGWLGDAIWGALDYIDAFSGAMKAAYGNTYAVKDLVEFLPEPLQRFERGLLLIANAAGHLVRAFEHHGIAGVFEVLPRELDNVWTAIKQLVGGMASLALDFVIDTAVSIGGWVWEHKDDIWGGIRDAAGWAAGEIPGKITAALNVAMKAKGEVLIWKNKVGDWIKLQLFGETGSSTTIDDITAKIKPTLKLATDVDWAGIAKDIALGVVQAVRDAVYNFTPLDMARFSYDFGQALGPAISEGITKAFNAVKADPVGAAKVALMIVGAITAFFLSPLILATVLTAALAVWIGAGIVGLATGIASSLFGIDFGDVATAIYNKIKDGIDAVTEWATALYDSGADLLQGLWDGITDLYDSTVESGWAGIADSLVTTFNKSITWLWQAGIDLLNGLWIGIKLFYDGTLMSGYRGIATFILTTFGKTITWLWQAGIDLLNGLWIGIKLFYDGTLKPKFTGIVTFILETFAGAIGWLWQAGRDAIQGLINGAESKIPGLQTTINTIKSLWGQIPLLGNSPWPMMIEAGQDAMMGLVIGANSKMGLLNQTISKAASTFDIQPASSQSAFGSMPTGVSASGGNSNTYGDIYITVSGVGDPDAVADRTFAKFNREFGLSEGSA